MNAKLHGEWIDCDQDADSIYDEIQQMLDASPEPRPEEFAIHDFEGWEGLSLHEHENIDDVAKAGQLIAEHGAVFAAVLGHCGGIDYITDATNILTENYNGCYDTLEDWAFDHIESTGALQNLPENLHCYFDHAAFGRDCELSGEIFTIAAAGQVHVFWSC